MATPIMSFFVIIIASMIARWVRVHGAMEPPLVPGADMPPVSGQSLGKILVPLDQFKMPLMRVTIFTSPEPTPARREAEPRQ
jgi:hypothetical protein